METVRQQATQVAGQVVSKVSSVAPGAAEPAQSPEPAQSSPRARSRRRARAAEPESPEAESPEPKAVLDADPDASSLSG